ncbi:hypothetical protein WN48_00053 [Eufriesea mexicana]|nr:hypothetical protein WN48_00053 [Eufriesea mexicana]
MTTVLRRRPHRDHEATTPPPSLTSRATVQGANPSTLCPTRITACGRTFFEVIQRCRPMFPSLECRIVRVISHLRRSKPFLY